MVLTDSPSSSVTSSRAVLESVFTSAVVENKTWNSLWSCRATESLYPVTSNATEDRESVKVSSVSEAERAVGEGERERYRDTEGERE